MTALTFVRGRTEVAITESGSPAAEAGQFAVHRSRSIRAATSDRVQVDVVGATPTSGGALLYFDPDNASSGGSQSSYGRVMSWLDPATTGALTLSGNEQTDATRATGTQGDGLTPPAGMGFWPAATNECGNGGATTNTTGWTPARATLTRITTDYKFGASCFSLLADGTTFNYARYSTAVLAAGTYTASVWVRAISGTLANVRLDVGGVGAVNASVAVADGWTRITVTGTLGAPAVVPIDVYVNYSGSASSGLMYFDGVQIESGSIATPYIETDGATASRSASRGRITVGSLINATQSWVAQRFTAGASSSAASTPPLFQIGDDANNFLALHGYSNGLRMARKATSIDTVDSSTTPGWSSGGSVTAVGAWTATTVKVSINGGAFASGGSTHIPTLAATTADIASDQLTLGINTHLSGAVRWMVLGTGTLTDADATFLNAFGDTPPTVSELLAGLSASAAPTALWDAVTSSYTVLPTAGIECWYDKANTAFKARRFTSGAGAIVSAAATFTAAAATMIYVAWDATTLYLSANGATTQTAANATIPTTAATTFDVGSYGGAAQYLNAAFGAVVELTAPISADQLAILAALRAERPPAPREAIEAKMAGLWYGGHTISWDFTASDCDGIDLINTAGVKVRETNGLGGAPVQNRIVETPLRDGASYVDTRLQPRVVRLPLAVYDEDSQADWYTLRRTLLAAFNPLPGPGVLTFAPSATLYEATAIYDSGLEYSERAGLYLQRSPLTLLCHDPAWRVAVAVEGTGTVPRGGWTIAWTIPWTIASSEVSVSLTSASDDSLDTFPVFVFTAGADGSTGLTITNTTTGETLPFGSGLTLTAGQVVTIDMGERTAVKDDGTNVIGYREAGSVMWALQPGANSVTVGVDSGSGTVKARHYTRLIGI